ncbi:hypothetical protein A0J61_05388 [Choanephora cucurbitarum]|uniref:Zn(2)-C6 fungal-type domain-containing protein n=1 Tax=Choanephora cucurbitarum TaxID=101091 RepID=A0A1C7NGP3_9FUNG|nr:hypothetical protein A0J61_05388 [Choanephora cucurbitarum]
MLPCAACRKGRRKCVMTDGAKQCQRCERLQKLCLSGTLATEEQQVEFLETQIQQLNVAYDQLASLHAAVRSNNARMVQLIRNWKIKIEDGRFIIETNINNIHDLMSLASIPYLSPWSNLGTATEAKGSGLLFKFRSESKSNWTPFMIKLFTRSSQHASLTEPPLPKQQLFVKHCVDAFFSCHYFFRVLVHENSFRAKLDSLQDPLSDLTVLSICCYVCAIPCYHMSYDLTELRHRADTCYKKAKSMLLDQFDVHEKRLENAVSICLLAHYLHVTLRFSESRRLLDLAYQLCLDLEKDNKGHLKLFQTTHSSFPNENMDPEATDDPDQAVLVRVIYLIIYFRRLVNFFSSESSYYEPRLRLPKWKYLSDEKDQVKRTIRSQNWIISIFSHPFITCLWKEIHCVRIGRTCKLSFETIFRVEEVMMEWASIVPEEFRLSKDLNSYDLCSSAIESTIDVFKILLFTDFHMIQISIFSSLLQPSEEDLQIAQFVLHYAHEKSLQSCMHSLVASDALFFIIRVVHLLTLSSEEHISIQARELMKACYEQMHHLPFIHGLYLSTEESPMADILTLCKKEKPLNLDYYDTYTHPWFTLMYDMTRFTATHCYP